MKLEHKAFWAVNNCNMQIDEVGEFCKLQLQELEELRLEAYDNATTYKEKTKAWHNKNILRKDFKQGDKVLLFMSRLRLFPGKLWSRWAGPYVIARVFSHGAVELYDTDGQSVFKVNGQRLKTYHEGFDDSVIEETDLQDPEVDKWSP